MKFLVVSDTYYYMYYDTDTKEYHVIQDCFKIPRDVLGYYFSSNISISCSLEVPNDETLTFWSSLKYDNQLYLPESSYGIITDAVSYYRQDYDSIKWSWGTDSVNGQYESVECNCMEVDDYYYGNVSLLILSLLRGTPRTEDIDYNTVCDTYKMGIVRDPLRPSDHIFIVILQDNELYFVWSKCVYEGGCYKRDRYIRDEVYYCGYRILDRDKLNRLIYDKEVDKSFRGIIAKGLLLKGSV